MFGIGLPEMIVIFAVALIVVGPDKLPGLARSLAKGLMELKKTLNDVKDNLTQEGDALDDVQKDLRKTAIELQGKMIDVDPAVWQAAHPTTPQPAEEDPLPEDQAIEAEMRESAREPQPAAAVETTDAAAPVEAPPEAVIASVATTPVADGAELASTASPSTPAASAPQAADRQC